MIPCAFVLCRSFFRFFLACRYCSERYVFTSIFPENPNEVMKDVILAPCFSCPNKSSMATGMMKEITRGGGGSHSRDINGIGSQ